MNVTPFPDEQETTPPYHLYTSWVNAWHGRKEVGCPLQVDAAAVFQRIGHIRST